MNYEKMWDELCNKVCDIRNTTASGFQSEKAKGRREAYECVLREMSSINENHLQGKISGKPNLTGRKKENTASKD